MPARTSSAGLAMLNADDTSLTGLMARADTALYQAKDAGRGQLRHDVG